MTLPEPGVTGHGHTDIPAKAGLLELDVFPGCFSIFVWVFR